MDDMEQHEKELSAENYQCLVKSKVRLEGLLSNAAERLEREEYWHVVHARTFLDAKDSYKEIERELENLKDAIASHPEHDD